MNLTYCHLETEGDKVIAVLPNTRLAVDKATLDNHPCLENHMNEELVIGLRPMGWKLPPWSDQTRSGRCRRRWR